MEIRFAVFIAVSLDGYIARPDGSIDFLAPFHDEEHGYGAFFAGIDALVIGRGTYDTALGFPETINIIPPHPRRWPPALHQRPSRHVAPPARGEELFLGRRPAALREAVRSCASADDTSPSGHTFDRTLE